MPVQTWYVIEHRTPCDSDLSRTRMVFELQIDRDLISDRDLAHEAMRIAGWNRSRTIDDADIESDEEGISFYYGSDDNDFEYEVTREKPEQSTTFVVMHNGVPIGVSAWKITPEELAKIALKRDAKTYEFSVVEVEKLDDTV